MPTELEPPTDLDVGHVMDQATWDAVEADRQFIENAVAVSEADTSTEADWEAPNAG